MERAIEEVNAIPRKESRSPARVSLSLSLSFSSLERKRICTDHEEGIDRAQQVLDAA